MQKFFYLPNQTILKKQRTKNLFLPCFFLHILNKFFLMQITVTVTPAHPPLPLRPMLPHPNETHTLF